MTTPYCSQCGREVKVRLHPVRNPRSRKHASPVRLKDHDLCRACYRAVMQAALNQQRQHG